MDGKRAAEEVVRDTALRSFYILEVAVLKRLPYCHQRSLVEAKMRHFNLLVECVMSRDFGRQVAGHQVRAAS